MNGKKQKNEVLSVSVSGPVGMHLRQFRKGKILGNQYFKSGSMEYAHTDLAIAAFAFVKACDIAPGDRFTFEIIEIDPEATI